MWLEHFYNNYKTLSHFYHIFSSSVLRHSVFQSQSLTGKDWHLFQYNGVSPLDVTEKQLTVLGGNDLCDRIMIYMYTKQILLTGYHDFRSMFSVERRPLNTCRWEQREYLPTVMEFSLFSPVDQCYCDFFSGNLFCSDGIPTGPLDAECNFLGLYNLFS